MSFKVIPRRLSILLLLYLLGHLSSASQTITITGLFYGAMELNPPVSVVAANPIATTFVNIQTITNTFYHESSTGTQLYGKSQFTTISTGTETGTITNTYIVGPSTHAYIEEIYPDFFFTEACTFTSKQSAREQIFRIRLFQK